MTGILWRRSRVYPRVCGGTPTSDENPRRGRGLSPRVRGNPDTMLSAAACAGSIPACAGEPSGSSVLRGARRVYPRVCGGTVCRIGASINAGGLSPRVRGNQCTRRPRPSGQRSIPACAGEPLDGQLQLSQRTVYPRVCGGTVWGAGGGGWSGGLSPRVRGNPHGADVKGIGKRSIPACAGEPRDKPANAEQLEVYPRVCGGTLRRQVNHHQVSGLSPRVRGNPPAAGSRSGGSRSIPACAGEPGGHHPASVSGRVYPRVCGGTALVVHRMRQVDGLSPRVRGNPHSAALAPHRMGSIPACAGEPATGRGCPPTCRVYPRVCGGTMT